jgi:solute carrier family 35 protein
MPNAAPHSLASAHASGDAVAGRYARRRAGALAALFYGSCSVMTVFLNKALFAVWKFKFPASLVTAQTLFTVGAILALERAGVVRRRGEKFSRAAFKRVFVVSAVFQLKLVLDMTALSLVNIPMYGVLKSATTPFVMLLDYGLLGKVASRRVQAAVFLTTLGGVLAGAGDLEFTLLGYVVALMSAATTAMYVVLVGKIGDELQLDSFTLLLYNSLWSAPLSMCVVFAFGEHHRVLQYEHLARVGFLFAFLLSCSSAFVLNYATYLCTQLNEALTTSVVGRTKSIVQGIAGLFAFKVHTSATNLSGIMFNSAGVAWYAYEKYMSARGVERAPTPPDASAKNIMHREDSQLTLESYSPRSKAKHAFNGALHDRAPGRKHAHAS